jgi:Methyltransferase FkbM domain
MFVDIVRSFSRTLLPAGKHFRKLPFGPVAGCTMKINFHYDLRLFLGLYERETKDWFLRLVKPGYQSFDVGGAGGYDALLLSKLSGGGKVVSFECEPQAVEEMRETFLRNPYPIEAVEAFVSDHDGDGHLCLNTASERFFVPDFIKMDIEGAEDQALTAASSIITARKPSMIVEVHGKDKEERCLEILASYGYKPIIVDRRKFLGEKRPMEHNRWLICPGRDASV